MDTIREKMQEDAVDDFMALETKRAVIIIGTGGGKTRISMEIIKRLKPAKVLFLVDSILGKELTIPAEMEKWGLKAFIPNTVFQTYQTAYKWKKKKVDLSDTFVIADEIDFAMTGKYGAFFKEYHDVQLLGMTGYMPEEKREYYKNLLPVLTEIPRETLQDQGIINKVKYRFIQFCLSKEKNRVVEYKNKGLVKAFSQSENDAYLYILKNIRKWGAKKTEAFNNGDSKELDRCEYILGKKIPMDRMNLLHGLDSVVDIVKRIKNDVLVENDYNKIVTFSQRTVQADKLSTFTYHGKNKDSLNIERFNSFAAGRIREMALCGKMKRGANIPNLTHAIMESFVDDAVTMNQRNGRLLRLPSDQMSTIYVMLPYYTNEDGELKPTQAIKWARNMFSTFDLDNEDWKVENYCGSNIVKSKL